MFLSLAQIERSLVKLRAVHPFFMLSFLVAKQQGLEVGKKKHIPYDRAETSFLQRYYRPAPSSGRFFAPWHTGRGAKRWVNPDYGSSGSQKTRTTTFASVFVHDAGTDLWGWHVEYLHRLVSRLRRGRRVPAFDLAVWLFRDEAWPDDTRPEDLVDRLLSQFKVTSEERDELFDVELPASSSGLLQPARVTWRELKAIIGSPPDAPPAEGGHLTHLGLRNVGPARRVTFEPADRLNLITGDNGLGKTFLLECAWWALTGEWTGRDSVAYPRLDARGQRAEISYGISGEPGEPALSKYDWSNHVWPTPRARSAVPGLVLYARVDDSFALWDPLRPPAAATPGGRGPATASLLLTREDVFEGVAGRCEGLLRDWITWANDPDGRAFSAFTSVLRRLSPPGVSDIGELVPSEPVRLPREVRQIPTLGHPYGVVPVVHASAAVRRVVAMAYLTVWAWEEHKVHAALAGRAPQSRMVILMDEIEAHLHPQWQRAILPAIMDVTKVLSDQVEAQFLVVTHSPLVLASVEQVFDVDEDRLFHLNIARPRTGGVDVVLEEKGFCAHGETDRWLRSDIFELRQARSLEGERAVESAMALQRQTDVTPDQVQEVSDRLVETLPPGDEFWPRWLYYAKQHGVRL